MIKFELNGIPYTCDTPEEVAKLQALLGKVQGSSDPVRGIINKARAESANLNIKEVAELTNFISLLKGLHKKEFSGEFLADALGVQSVTGLGPRMASLAKRLDSFNVDLWQVVSKEIRPGQPTIWRINQEALNRVNIQ